MGRRFCRVLTICAFAIVGSAHLLAQEGGAEIDTGEGARFHFGPLRFTPTLALNDLGIDTNVFNDAENPKRDRVGSFAPSTNLWMRVGSSIVSGTVSVSYLYFEQYRGQRALNTDDALKWAVPLNRITPFVRGSYARAKSRAGYEIDTRVRQVSQSVGLGTDVHVSDRIRLVLSGDRAQNGFDDNELYRGADLAAALNRRTDEEHLQLIYRLTSLTRFVVAAEAVQDRFDSDSIRNTNTIAVMPGFEMKPLALVSGRVFVGYRAFEPLSPTLPPSRGLAAAVEAVLNMGETHLGVSVNRDVAFSYRADRPYYTLLDGGLSLRRQITYSWDAVVRAAQQQLDYVGSATPDAEQGGDVERIRQYGLGLGYRIGRTLRFGLDANYARRSAGALHRDFEGLRVGASISYGQQR